MFHDVKFLKSILLASTSFSPFQFAKKSAAPMLGNEKETGGENTASETVAPLNVVKTNIWQNLFDTFDETNGLSEDEIQNKKSAQKPNRRRLKVELSVTPLLAGLLAACGDTKYVPIGGGTTTPPTPKPPTTPPGGGTINPLPFDVYVADGTIEGAGIYVDDGDGVFDKTKDTYIGKTDENGRIRLDATHAGKKIFADISGAVDLFTGKIFEANAGHYTTTASARGASDAVASPVTTAIAAMVAQLKAADSNLTDAQAEAKALELLFGDGTHITMAHVTNSDNYIMPAAGTYAAKSPAGIAQAIAKLAIELQVLFEEEAAATIGKFAADDVAKVVREKLLDGYDKTTDLTGSAATDAAYLIAEAEQRGAGEPFANPNITRGANTSASTPEDTAITIDIADWGFRDPVGNTDGFKSIENLIGSAHNDTLWGDANANTLSGGAGNDTLTGGLGDDIFVLDIASTETKDAVTDFGTGTDKIRVDTTAGNDTTLTALQNAANLRWTNDTNEATGSTNDASTNDTVIYNTKGTEDTSDDVIIMVLEDYTTALTIDNFEII
ncbi:MAG: hypothetical protein ACON41_01350 [Parvibaculales bacterium]